MTEELIELLQQYGMLSVSLSHLASERPRNKFASLDEYYQSFGGLLPDEPAVVVRISKDGELRFLHEGEHDVSFQDKEGKKVGVVTVWEMPENEFWFFKAFRPGLLTSIRTCRSLFMRWVLHTVTHYLRVISQRYLVIGSEPIL